MMVILHLNVKQIVTNVIKLVEPVPKLLQDIIIIKVFKQLYLIV